MNTIRSIFPPFLDDLPKLRMISKAMISFGVGATILVDESVRGITISFHLSEMWPSRVEGYNLCGRVRNPYIWPVYVDYPMASGSNSEDARGNKSCPRADVRMTAKKLGSVG